MDGVGLVKPDQPLIYLEAGQDLKGCVSVCLLLEWKQSAPTSRLHHTAHFLLQPQLNKDGPIHRTGLAKPLHPQASEPLLEVKLLKCRGRGDWRGRGLLYGSCTRGRCLGSLPLSKPRSCPLCSDHPTREKIRCLDHKNTKFSWTRNTYDLLPGRLMAIWLREIHLYRDLTAVSHGLKL